MRTITVKGKKYQIRPITENGVITEIPGELVGAQLISNDGLPVHLKLYDAITRAGHGPLLELTCEDGRHEIEKVFYPWKLKRYEGGLAARIEPPTGKALICYRPLDIFADIARIREILEKGAVPQWIHEYRFILTAAETERKVWFFPGIANYLYVKKNSGIATVKLDSPNFQSWDLTENAQIKFPFEKIYLTWAAQNGKQLLIYISNKKVDKKGYRPFYINYSAPANIDVTNSSTEILPANGARKYLCIVNDSNTTIYLAIGDDAEVNKGIRLNANGGNFEMTRDNLSYEAVNGIHDAGAVNKRVTVQEAS